MKVSLNINQPNQVKSGLCPHGLPPSACPICSGMGGGSSKPKSIYEPRKPGEMSYAECVAEGARIRARMQAEKRQEKLDIELQKQSSAVKKVVEHVRVLLDKVANLKPVKVVKEVIKVVTEPVRLLVKQVVFEVVRPLVKFIKNIVQRVLNFNISQRLIDISDKVLALLGGKRMALTDLKNKIKKKIKKLLFVLVDVENEDSEQPEVRINDLFKIVIEKLKGRNK